MGELFSDGANTTHHMSKIRHRATHGGNSYPTHGGNSYPTHGGNSYPTHDENSYPTHGENSYPTHGIDCIRNYISFCDGDDGDDSFLV